MNCTKIAGFLCLGFLWWSGAALAYTINDGILVGRGNNHVIDPSYTWMDVVGGPTYEAYGIDVHFSAGNMTISLYTNFGGAVTVGGSPTTPGVLISLADLALDLDLDGRYEYGVSLTTREVVTGRLYGNVTWNTSSYYLEDLAMKKTFYDHYYGESWGDATHNPSHNGQNPIVHIASGTPSAAPCMG